MHRDPYDRSKFRNAARMEVEEVLAEFAPDPQLVADLEEVMIPIVDRIITFNIMLREAKARRAAFIAKLRKQHGEKIS